MIEQVSGIKSMQGVYQVQTSTLMESNSTSTDKVKADDYKVELNTKQDTSVTYDRNLKVASDLMNLNSDEDNGLNRLVVDLIKRQGMTLQDALSGKSINVDDQAKAEANALIAPDGELGVDKTAERIFQFAISGAEGDTSKLEDIKAAITKGFEMAKEALGGSLPDISSKTYDAIMEKLDSWAKNSGQTQQANQESSFAF
ncbi:MAG: hypothetical protein HQK77_12070 [Desulfobacterales bacterium]|nr:hypothetical protein [Desulfobacterales bacterium]